MEGGNRLEHAGGKLPLFLLLIQESKLVANGLRLGALAARVGQQPFELRAGRIVLFLFFQTDGRHETRIEKHVTALHREREFFLRFVDQSHILVCDAQRIMCLGIQLVGRFQAPQA